MADINLVNVKKYFGDLCVIRRMNLEVKDGEFMVLLGPSGCGKTTTLRAIAGLEEVDAGDILIDRKSVKHLRARDRDMAFVFQSYALYPHLTAFENIAFPLKATKTGKAVMEERVRDVARVLQIEHILKKKPSQLSSGDMQRVAVGRAMVRRPKAFLMDEPIGSLDARLREGMRTELKHLHMKIRATTVYVTHDQIEAMSIADNIAIMHDGTLQQIGSPDEVYDHPANLFVAQFIGSPIMNVLDCAVANDGGKTMLILGRDGLKFPLSRSLFDHIRSQNIPEGQLALGVRSEAVLVEREAKGNYVKAEVKIIEPIGPHDFVDVTVGDQMVRAKTPPRYVSRSDKKVWIGLEEQRIHFFDKRSGSSLDIR
jgi:multiple sugar transport system ATP-binding protein